MLHLKFCSLKSNVTAVAMQALSFKSNFQWLQTTYDLTSLQGGNIDGDTEELKNYLWRPGPFLWPLQTFLSRKSTLRGEFKVSGNSVDQFHMGLGAATHMSQVAEPGERIMKLFGVIEQTTALPKTLLYSAKKGHLTASKLIKATIDPWCGSPDGRYISVHTSSLKSNRSRSIVWEAIPWIVRLNPQSFPFLLPLPLLSSLQSDDPKVQVAPTSIVHTKAGDAVMSAASEVIMITGQPQWTDQCYLPEKIDLIRLGEDGLGSYGVVQVGLVFAAVIVAMVYVWRYRRIAYKASAS